MKKICFIVFILILLFSISSCTLLLSSIDDNTDTTTTANEITTIEESKEETKNSLLEFTLSWNITGEYGKEIVLNKDTEDEYIFVGFYIPSGTYLVKNENKKTACQISIYSGINYDGQYDECVSDGCPRPLVLMQNSDEKELVISDGQFIKLADGDTDITFKKIS